MMLLIIDNDSYSWFIMVCLVSTSFEISQGALKCSFPCCRATSASSFAKTKSDCTIKKWNSTMFWNWTNPEAIRIDKTLQNFQKKKGIRDKTDISVQGKIPGWLVTCQPWTWRFSPKTGQKSPPNPSPATSVPVAPREAVAIAVSTHKKVGIQHILVHWSSDLNQKFGEGATKNGDFKISMVAFEQKTGQMLTKVETSKPQFPSGSSGH